MRLPRGYDDLGRVTPIAALARRRRRHRRAGARDGPAAARLSAPAARRLRRARTGRSVRARWFRPHAVDGEGVREGEPASRWRGRCARPPTARARWSIRATSPPRSAAAPAGGLGLRPRYADVEGVKRRTLASIRASALARARRPGRPSCCRRRRAARLGLPALAESFRALHAPAQASDVADDALGAGAPAHRARDAVRHADRVPAAAGGGGRGGAGGAGRRRRAACARAWRRRWGSR